MTDDKTLVARLRLLGLQHLLDREIALLMAEAADRIEALEAERQWRPIASAPRDGTAILASDGLTVASAFYFDSNFVTEDIEQWNVTHWMRLPEAPHRTTD